MAYPGENEHVEYMDYLEKVATGEIQGKHVSKDEWRKMKKEQQQKPKTSAVHPAAKYGLG